MLPVPYGADYRTAEAILLAAARRHSVPIAELGEAALREMQRRYFMKRAEIEPRVYCRLTDNWVELTVRFVVRDHGIRELKDAMSREVVEALEREHLNVASQTLEVIRRSS